MSSMVINWPQHLEKSIYLLCMAIREIDTIRVALSGTEPNVFTVNKNDAVHT